MDSQAVQTTLRSIGQLLQNVQAGELRRSFPANRPEQSVMEAPLQHAALHPCAENALTKTLNHAELNTGIQLVYGLLGSSWDGKLKETFLVVHVQGLL